jgi:FtsH-binding integral membrane protein
MELDAKDIEAIARSRVNRNEGNRQTYFMAGAMLAIIIGAFIAKVGSEVTVTSGIGWILCIGGVITFFWYMNTISKKQRILKALLLKEWQEEKK